VAAVLALAVAFVAKGQPEDTRFPLDPGEGERVDQLVLVGIGAEFEDAIVRDREIIYRSAEVPPAVLAVPLATDEQDLNLVDTVATGPTPEVVVVLLTRGGDRTAAFDVSNPV